MYVTDSDNYLKLMSNVFSKIYARESTKEELKSSEIDLQDYVLFPSEIKQLEKGIWRGFNFKMNWEERYITLRECGIEEKTGKNTLIYCQRSCILSTIDDLS